MSAVTRTSGTIAAGDPQTASAGAEVLRAGGNAIDAVCAAAFAAFVVEPPLCSPAGAGALLAGNPSRGLRVLDFFACAPGLGAPAAPNKDFFDVTVDFGPTGQVFHIGRASAAVPGALPGLLALHAAEGNLPLAEVVAPAIAFARDGYVLGPGVAFIVSILEPILRHTPEVAAIFGIGERLPVAGATLDNPRLADFLDHLARAPDEAMRGAFAEAMLAEFGHAQGGLLTRRDLEVYQPVWREPLWTEFAGLQFATNPPPSSGGTLVALGLRLAEPLKLHRHAFGSSAHAMEVSTLLTALSDVRADGYDDRVADSAAAAQLLGGDHLAKASAAHARRREERQLGGTTHISVLDGDGELASLTMSNGEGCGSALPSLGIHVNNFLGEEDINPHGFHRLPAGRRMTTMMAPSAVCRGDAPQLVLGSGGSNRIRSAILQVLLARTVWDVDLQAAITAPRLHVEGDTLWYEAPGWSEEAIAALRSGWTQSTQFDAPNMFFGGVHAVRPGGAVGDPRRGGAIAVV